MRTFVCLIAVGALSGSCRQYENIDYYLPTFLSFEMVNIVYAVCFKLFFLMKYFIGL